MHEMMCGNQNTLSFTLEHLILNFVTPPVFFTLTDLASFLSIERIICDQFYEEKCYKREIQLYQRRIDLRAF